MHQSSRLARSAIVAKVGIVHIALLSDWPDEALDA
jgi:hypothetical protein